MDEQMAVFKEIDGFICPAEFWPALGYEGEARYVAIWWEQCGDEASWSDGRSLVVGADWLAYRALLNHNLPHGATAYWLLGSSDTPATFHLVIERESERAWLVPVDDVEELLRGQWTTYESERLLEMIESGVAAQYKVESYSTASVIVTFEIEEHLATQQARLDAFTKALDARPR